MGTCRKSNIDTGVTGDGFANSISRYELRVFVEY